MAGLGLNLGLGLGGGAGAPSPRKVTPVPGRIAYLELPVGDVDASAAFFRSAFGWDLTRFAPTYAGTMGEGTDLGLQGDPAESSRAPLAGIEVDDLEAAMAAVEAAGGTVTRPIFAFPGGRRFHFTEPSGNELAVFVTQHNGDEAV